MNTELSTMSRFADSLVGKQELTTSGINWGTCSIRLLVTPSAWPPLVFGNVIDKAALPLRRLARRLKNYSDKLFKDKNYTLNASAEIEGFCSHAKTLSKNTLRRASSSSLIPAATIT